LCAPKYLFGIAMWLIIRKNRYTRKFHNAVGYRRIDKMVENVHIVRGESRERGYGNGLRAFKFINRVTRCFLVV